MFWPSDCEVNIQKHLNSVGWFGSCSYGLWPGEGPPRREGFPLGAQRRSHGRGETVWRNTQVCRRRHQAGDYDQGAFQVILRAGLHVWDRWMSAAVAVSNLPFCCQISGEDAQREKWPVVDELSGLRTSEAAYFQSYPGRGASQQKISPVPTRPQQFAPLKRLQRLQAGTNSVFWPNLLQNDVWC